MFWYLTNVDILLDLLFDHIVEGPDQYQELPKHTMVPEDLYAKFYRSDKLEAVERH